MRSPSRRTLLALLAAALPFATALPAEAAETSNAEFVIIPEGDVFPGDLYAGAVRVRVEGIVEGDLIAFAAEEVVVNGEVTGSVTAITPRLEIDGAVGGSVRSSAVDLAVTGTISGDLVAAVWDGRLAPGSTVSGDVLVWATSLDAAGAIGDDLTGSQRTLDLAGEVGGDVDVSVGRLEIGESLEVGGDLGYRSARDAVGLENARVEGAIVEKTPLAPNIRVRALVLLGRFMVILFLTLAGLAVAYGWPERTRAAVQRVGTAPLRDWASGALVVFSPLLVAAITGLMLALAPATVAFPLLIVLVPLVLALAGLVLAVAVVAGIPVAARLGGRLLKRSDLYGSVLAGSALLGLAWWLPVIGWLVPILVLPWGLGAWMRSRADHSADLDLPVSS